MLQRCSIIVRAVTIPSSRLLSFSSPSPQDMLKELLNLDEDDSSLTALFGATTTNAPSSRERKRKRPNTSQLNPAALSLGDAVTLLLSQHLELLDKEKYTYSGGEYTLKHTETRSYMRLGAGAMRALSIFPSDTSTSTVLQLQSRNENESN